MQALDEFQRWLGGPIMPVLDAYWPMIVVFIMICGFGLLMSRRVNANGDVDWIDGDADDGDDDHRHLCSRLYHDPCYGLCYGLEDKSLHSRCS